MTNRLYLLFLCHFISEITCHCQQYFPDGSGRVLQVQKGSQFEQLLRQGESKKDTDFRHFQKDFWTFRDYQRFARVENHQWNALATFGWKCRKIRGCDWWTASNFIWSYSCSSIGGNQQDFNRQTEGYDQLWTKELCFRLFVNSRDLFKGNH